MKDKRVLLFFGILLVSLIYAVALGWVAEDSYISFRYARNLIDGHGLVFNPGERVEGYTNFLWTILLAAGLSAGLSPFAISVSLGLLFTTISFLALLRLHKHYFPDADVPAALLALGLNYTWASFSTGGLETSLLAALLLWAFALVLCDPENPKRAGFAGVLLALAAMTRPDAALAGMTATVLLAFDRRFRALAWLVLPAALVYVPYFLWRYRYYGFLLPNTFYAKSAGLTYYHQGWIYLREFLQRHWLWPFLPFPLIAAAKGRLRGWLLPAVFLLIYSFYVIRVGGDFMEGRFFVPVLPFLYLILEASIRSLLSNPRWVLIGLALLCLFPAGAPALLPPRTIVDGITDERTWQPVVELWLREGAVMRSHLPQDTVLATDAVGAFGYKSRLPIIDTLGLTDATVARLPVTVRSRPGHEKAATLEYLRSRNVAVIRDGVGLYQQLGASAAIYAGNRYYILTKDAAAIAGFHDAIRELTMFKGADQEK